MAKSGKTLNPADKARREARKKELKKNKKQRQQVRTAVVEKKDPDQIIADLEKLDRFEFDVRLNPSMTDTLYKDKRKRLKETYAKILEHYSKEDPEKHGRLKRLESDYERRHQNLVREHQAMKAALEVKLEDVLLPPDPDCEYDDLADDDPLMSENIYIIPKSNSVMPPGCPPGLPPDLHTLARGLSMPSVAPILPSPLEYQNIGIPGHLPIAASATQQRSFNRNQRPRHGVGGLSTNIGQEQEVQDHRSKPSRDELNIPKPTKSAVIESKPVLFVSKVTKFVPSSVRTKVKLVDGAKDKP